VVAVSHDPATASVCRDRLLLLVGAVLFAVAHTQAPLYFSNQHQYFLHGLAEAGKGYLARDWLAGTRDPTPAFSAFIAFTHRHLNDFVFQAVFSVVIGIYFISLMAVGGLFIAEGPARRQHLIVLAALFIVVHSGIIRLASVRILGADYPWYAQAGVAGQYALGPGLQPSAFGVFLISAVAAFAYGRLALATCCVGVACSIHATYLLPAAMFVLAFMIALWHEKRGRAALLVGAGAFLLVLPTVVHSLLIFGPSSPEQFREAQRILAEVRIPHHTMIRRWFDTAVIAQIAWVTLALVLAKRTCLFLPMLIPAILAIALTLVQFFVDSYTLALLFPWRASVVLVPVATAIIFARFVSILPVCFWILVVALVAMAAAVSGGIVIMATHKAYHANDLELPALQYVRDHKSEDDVYVIPVRIPSSGAGARGVPSTSFTPPPTERHLITVDLQRFRLFTGARLYIDFKAIPYKDVEVLEWHRRLMQTQKQYARKDWNDPLLTAELHEEGITHVLMPADRPIAGAYMQEVFADDYYRIYRVR
jgi:hypothetical protein